MKQIFFKLDSHNFLKSQNNKLLLLCPSSMVKIKDICDTNNFDTILKSTWEKNGLVWTQNEAIKILNCNCMFAHTGKSSFIILQNKSAPKNLFANV